MADSNHYADYIERVFAVDLAGSNEDLHATVDRLAQRVGSLRAEALGAALAA